MPAGRAKHVFIVSNDGIPEELKPSARARSTPPSPSPPTSTPSTRCTTLKAAVEGKTFKPGKTDHDCTIIEVRDGLLRTSCPRRWSPTTAAPTAACASVKSDDKSLWGNRPRLTRPAPARIGSEHKAVEMSDGERAGTPRPPRRTAAGPGGPARRRGDRHQQTIRSDGRAGRRPDHHPARRDPRAGRTQRRRQVDAGVRPHRPAGPRRGNGPLRRRAGAPARRPRRLASPVACVYQKSTIIPTLTVAENLFLNRQTTARRLIRWRPAASRAPRSCWRLRSVDVDPQTAGRRPDRRAAAVRRDRAGAVVRRAVHHPRRADRPARRPRRSTGSSTGSATCRARA